MLKFLDKNNYKGLTNQDDELISAYEVTNHLLFVDTDNNSVLAVNINSLKTIATVKLINEDIISDN